ncbi:hypothetical protein KP509_24G057500 [Ceratopteris richardii]|uniref:Early light-induced protein n=1 Tax=Ceratopteris richardii TaxID=49495 RepID=A0A8T2RXN5_CERRI|nr:hypothetical protein KP509_24G057500 [Ceratopteris richardii]
MQTLMRFNLGRCAVRNTNGISSTSRLNRRPVVLCTASRRRLWAVACSTDDASSSSTSKGGGARKGADGQNGLKTEADVGSSTLTTSSKPQATKERPDESSRGSLMDFFKFDGIGPETTNGRLAMVGIMWALLAERTTGLTTVEQLLQPSSSGLLWFALVVQLFTFASLIPFLKGEYGRGWSWGPFTAKAELWNGRLAMIGFAALLITELVRQSPITLHG